jgi:hypothetical protein
MIGWLTLALVTGFLPSPGYAQSSTSGDGDLFQKYRVADTFRGKPAPLDLSSHDARAFRTRLREAMSHGPAFAGYYAVAVWGCGSSCRSAAIIDLRTGEPTFFPATIQNDTNDPHRDEEPLTFKLHSRAWHVIGDLNEKEKDGNRWYIWTGSEFKLISEKLDKQVD